MVEAQRLFGVEWVNKAAAGLTGPERRIIFDSMARVNTATMRTLVESVCCISTAAFACKHWPRRRGGAGVVKQAGTQLSQGEERT